LVVRAFLGRTHETSPESTATGSSFEALGRRWADIGLRPGDLALLCLPNGIALLEHFFGVLLVGGVPVLAAPNTPSARLRELAEVLGVRAVGANRINPTALGASQRETVGALEVALFPAREPVAAPGEVVLLTSGTSGFASGCVFSIEALLLNAERHADAIGQRPDDAVLVNLPLHFSFAIVAQALATLIRGGRLVLCGPPFHAPSYVQTLARHEITVSSLTPIQIPALLQSASETAASLRVLTVGGDALDPEQVGRLLQWRPGRELHLTYGLTQAGPRVATLAAHAEPPRRHRSIGRPLTGTRICLEDAGDGRKQLFVSSATVMRRRIGRVEGRPGDDLAAPGTIATGDLFEQDADGYLYFQGRQADYIVRDGEKICLAAVRRVAAQLPHVVNARTRVMARPDGVADFELTLYGPPDLEDYTGLLRKVLRRAEMPRTIHVEPVSQAHLIQYK
jgi:long-chain acyl-CoA synthetase